ncbi:MAG: AMP-binding protein, partial [Kineosporiaceae bacterium]
VRAHRIRAVVRGPAGVHAPAGTGPTAGAEPPELTWSWPDAPGAVRPTVTRPSRSGRLVVLTSGTTGVPRGVSRRLPLRVLAGPAGTHLRLIPLREGEPIVVAAPLHHGYGLAYLAAGLALGCPVVLAAGLTAEQVLHAAATHHARLLVLLPLQLRRICELPAEVLAGYPLDDLGAVVSAAAALSPALHARAVEVFGERIFNLYGSTEAGWASIATPADLRTAPGTVGRPPHGIKLRILDASGAVAPPGRIGEVHVHGWDPKGGWHPTGDLGHLDAAGRLHLDGRVDDMIVSGGENVYPGPVLATLRAHPDVDDAVVAPRPDAEFGQRLHVTVARRSGSGLTPEQLRDWLRTRLSRAEQPRDIEVVEELARTATGKPLRPGGGRAPD